MGADSRLRRARGEGIRALWGPDFQEMGAGFSRWDQVFQRPWVPATPIMFLKMHLMNCSHFETSVGAKLAESAGTRWPCRVKRLPGAELEFPRAGGDLRFACCSVSHQPTCWWLRDPSADGPSALLLTKPVTFILKRTADALDSARWWYLGLQL